MNLLARIADDLAGYVGTSITHLDACTLEFSLADGDSYEVSLDEFDEDEDDPIGGEPMSSDYPRPGSIIDHVGVLDAILNAIADSPHRQHVTGLTTDGDGSDCEAVFHLYGDPTVLRVR